MMKKMIIARLRKIENDENIRILFAVESGSRAWGFASDNSDYDVRFIYMRPMQEYLRLDRKKDVLNFLTDSSLLDINGWDLDKTLKLMYRSNPTLYEWLSSPIVYIKTDFADQLKEMCRRYFVSKNSLFHYIGMAENNNKEFLRNKEFVSVKKYLYVFLPLLSCKWILQYGKPAPMLFAALMESQLEESLQPDVKRLLDIKINHPENIMIQRVEKIDHYIEENLELIKNEISLMSGSCKQDYNLLNDLLIHQLNDW